MRNKTFSQKFISICEVRRQALMKRFGSIRAIESASLSQLQTVLPANAAHAVYDRFHPADVVISPQ